MPVDMMGVLMCRNEIQLHSKQKHVEATLPVRGIEMEIKHRCDLGGLGQRPRYGPDAVDERDAYEREVAFGEGHRIGVVGIDKIHIERGMWDVLGHILPLSCLAPHLGLPELRAKGLAAAARLDRGPFSHGRSLAEREKVFESITWKRISGAVLLSLSVNMASF